MPNINLTQIDLNQSLRGLNDAEIMMFLPDKGVVFPSNAVTVNAKALNYTSRLQSIVEMTSLPQANIATFENNSWILDGSFMSPSEEYSGGGDSYSGYISNDMTDDEGNYTTNPVLTIQLASTVPIIHYISTKFAGGIDTSYPKQFIIRTYNSSTLIKEHEINISEVSGMPLLVAEIEDENVNKVEFEFVGTVCPHRRSRLNKIMFGKVEQVDPNYLQSWKIDDKASLVADSIPTKTLTYDIINYDGDYNIDNPGTKVPNNYRDVLVLFTFKMEVDGLWKYTPTKTFNLLDISTTSEGIVTFSCGSLLDTLTETYDHDTYTGKRTIQEIMNDLLSFSGVGTDQCVLNKFAGYEINIPLPESPVREIIQKLAFSCGATLLTDDDNRIIFSETNIAPTEGVNSKFMFNQPDPFESAGVFLEEPKAEALEHTKNIAMYTYDSKTDDETSELGTIDVAVMTPTRISFSPAEGGVQFDNQSLQDQLATITVYEAYSQHAIIQLTWTEEAQLPIKVKVLGRKVETTQTTPININTIGDNKTLLLDSGLAYESDNNKNIMNNLIRPSNPNPNTFYYDDWYNAKFKYVCKTRNEYLIKAGDVVYFETPFSNGLPIRVGYVLRNSYSNKEDSGEMEVVTLGDNS